MIELKDKNMIYLQDYDIKIKKYLTKEEIELIAEEMLRYEKLTERNYIKNILLCKIATDIPESFNYEEDYEKLILNGIIDEICKNIININDIDAYVKYVESAEIQLNRFLGALNEPFMNLLKTANNFVQNLDTNKLVKLLAKADKNGTNK